jgi:hypothetical protein
LPTGSGLPPTKNRQLTPRAPQRSFQSLLLLIPAGFFGLRSLLGRLHFGLDGGGLLRVLLLGLVQRSLRLVDRLLTAFTVLLPGGLFLRPFKLAALLFPFVVESGLSLRSLVDGAGGRLLRLTALRPCGLRAAFVGLLPSPRLVGNSACSPNDPSDPTGRLRTTPGFFMAAAMTSGSSLSFAAPWWKRLLSAPHASRAAFIDGAAIARSKKPSEVW